VGIISADLVKTLRDQTGVGMMECKKALSESGGDLSKAVKILREKGSATAAKKSGRATTDGLVAVRTSGASSGASGVLVEVSCETDFVARNEKFQEFVRTVASIALEKGGDVDRIKTAPYPGGGTVTEKLTELVATIGENMSIRRSAAATVATGHIAQYVHNSSAPGLGKIGVLVELVCDSAAEAGMPELATLGEELAMQIAAANPQYLRREDVPAARIEEEKSILSKQVDPNKPPQVREKILEGKLSSFYEQVCLLEQPYIENRSGR